MNRIARVVDAQWKRLDANAARWGVDQLDVTNSWPTPADTGASGWSLVAIDQGHQAERGHGWGHAADLASANWRAYWRSVGLGSDDRPHVNLFHGVC